MFNTKCDDLFDVVYVDSDYSGDMNDMSLLQGMSLLQHDDLFIGNHHFNP